VTGTSELETGGFFDEDERSPADNAFMCDAASKRFGTADALADDETGADGVVSGAGFDGADLNVGSDSDFGCVGADVFFLPPCSCLVSDFMSIRLMVFFVCAYEKMDSFSIRLRDKRIFSEYNFMKRETKKVSFMSRVVARDDEPVLEGEDVYATLQDLATRFTDAFTEYEYVGSQRETNPYVFFETDFFKEDRENEQKEEARLKGPDLNELPDSEHQCIKCKSRKVLTTQEQIRSGDEGATTIYNCQNCSHSWR
jgi:DNA-directed RNA polymerase subunit M/transcription elongation factor TFIIS